MAQFSINIGARQDQAPDQVGDLDLSLQWDEDYTFTSDDFTVNTIPQYHHPQGYIADKIKILSIPVTGSLQLNGVAVILNQEITLVDVGLGLLTYISDDITTTVYTDTFLFTVADATSGLYSTDNGVVTIGRAEKPNEPPSEVGDGEATIDYASTLVFTRSMFTTATTPPYADPEGDAALNLRIDSLPVDGLLKVNGVNCTINQVVSFANIDAGLFIYVSDTADSDGDLETFNFSIADAGSGQFTS